jgi:hypothetical protein
MKELSKNVLRFHINVRFNYITLLRIVAFFFRYFFQILLHSHTIFSLLECTYAQCTYIFMIGRIPEEGLNIFGEG